MIEDFALPRWEDDLLINNVLTLRTARALIGNTPLSTIPYDQGIGFDNVYPPHRFLLAIAEASACGAATVIKGTEYVEDGVFSLLTAEQFAAQRETCGKINRWLEAHAELYIGREISAPIGLLYPGENLFWQWDQLAPLYFGVGQTLLMAGIPWQVVTSKEDCADLDVLLTFDEPCEVTGVETLHIPDLPGWELLPYTFWERHPTLHMLVSRVVGKLYQAYFENRWFRAVGDMFGITSLYVTSPLFNLPKQERRKTLLDALPELPYPQVKSDRPILVELWKRGEERQLHLVNYATETVKISTNFSEFVRGYILSPNKDVLKFHESLLEIELDLYQIIIWRVTK